MIKIDWVDFKSFVNDKQISFHWFDRNEYYTLYASDGLLSFECNLYKSPSDTTDLDDFESNYKDYQNLPSHQVVTPTSIKNEYVLNADGMHARRYLPEDYHGTITLTNKTGSTYDYTKSLSADLTDEDCVWFFNDTGYFQRVYIDSVNSTSITLIDEIPAGTYELSRMLEITYQLNPLIDIHYLWAVMFDTVGQGKYDWAVLEVYNPVTSELIIKYDECWVSQLNKLVRIGSPDGAAGELPAVELKIEYYYADDNYTGNVVKADYVTTFKE